MESYLKLLTQMISIEAQKHCTEWFINSVHPPSLYSLFFNIISEEPNFPSYLIWKYFPLIIDDSVALDVLRESKDAYTSINDYFLAKSVRFSE